MRNLSIEKLKYVIKCDDDSIYGAFIPFVSGLNVIFGPNSVGKSSIITGIIYGLGAEKTLGIFKSKQNPFKPEFYDKIENRRILNSYLLLEISNGSQKITIKRNITGETNFCIVKECTLEDFDKFSHQTNLIIEGKGVMSDKGFQQYLFEFLDWDVVIVPTYDGDDVKLYLENLVPLFFVEQRAGWSQIQASQVTRYRIRDVKKVAFEYLMGLEKFDIHLYEMELKEVKNELKKLKDELEWKTSSILISGNASVDSDNNLIVNKVGLGEYEINELISFLTASLGEIEKTIKDLTGKTAEISSVVNDKRDNLMKISHLRRVASEKIVTLNKEIASYQSYIAKIEINSKKNFQLKELEEIPFELNLSHCPICEKKLNESGNYCKLCKSEISRLSTPIENIEFLEDEKASFVKILRIKQLDLEKAKESYENLKKKEAELKEILDFQIKTYYGKELDKLRKYITEVDLIHNDILKYKALLDQWLSLTEIRENIDKLIEKESQLKHIIKQYRDSINDEKILGKVLLNFRKNITDLHLFKANENLINEINLDSNDSYTPYMETYDLYNISSSSDNIRIILSYYLSLLQTAVELAKVKKIKYPNLLILDEPKQQNLDEGEFKSFIKIISKLPESKWQIILTTYDTKNKSYWEKFIVYEMSNSNDFLLKKTS